jgi:hypothetical protein
MTGRGTRKWQAYICTRAQSIWEQECVCCPCTRTWVSPVAAAQLGEVPYIHSSLSLAGWWEVPCVICIGCLLQQQQLLLLLLVACGCNVPAESVCCRGPAAETTWRLVAAARCCFLVHTLITHE